MGGGVIVDAHVHFWDPAELRYPWLESLPPLCQAFGPAEYARAARDASVGRIIAVEANCDPSQTLREVAHLERLAAVDSRIEAIVAYAPLTDARERARTLDCLGEHPRVKGVRQNIQGEPRGFCLEPAFVDGVHEVGRRGYAFDLCVTSDLLPDAIELAERCPDTRFVLDHLGKPRIRDGADHGWRGDIERLAECGYVACKISGLLTEASPRQSADELLAYVHHAVACFGADRVMFGSDWPVLTLAGTYAEWYRITRALTASWTPDAVRRFYCDNATRFYGL